VFTLVTGGGTSEATRLAAGMVAAAAQQGSKKPFGFLDPVLYKPAGTTAFRDVLPLTAATPALDRATSCPAADCGAQGLLVFDVQSDDTAQGLHRAGHAEGLRQHDRPWHVQRPVLHQRAALAGKVKPKPR
jgi:hypothetical protein